METGVEGKAVLVQTDASGVAQTTFKLGQRAGTGNHKVRARVVGFDDEVVFFASALPKIGNKLGVNSGNNQRGGVFQPLPAPFVVTVTDEGANVIAGARVRFEVVEGGGLFQNDFGEYETVTDGDGRASAHLKLGGLVGLDRQIVNVTLIDAPPGEIITAGFSASGFQPADPAATTISGVVYDNQDNPLEGVTVRVDGTTREANADAEGLFTISQVPVGPVHLVADGSTALAAGEYPTLSYNIVTVSGVDNPLASPIYMVRLDTDNAVFAGPQDAVLTHVDVPGFKLEIAAGSVTFPDGSKEGLVSVTTVNASKMPMAPPDGMQPQYVVTIQPTNARFDPPAPLTVPNVDGHPPGAQIEMFSYDHDLEEFVAIGLGTVSSDGSLLESNPGVGVVKAGWHFAIPPGDTGCAKGPSSCGDFCYTPKPGCDSGCVFSPDSPAVLQIPGDCKINTCGGGTIGDDSDTPTDTCKVCDGGEVKNLDITNIEARAGGSEELFVSYSETGVSVDFTGNVSSHDCQLEYHWDFGDGSSSTKLNPSHVFTSQGEFDVKFTAKCSGCSQGSKSDTIKVNVFSVDIVTPVDTAISINPTPAMPSPSFQAQITPSSLVDRISLAWWLQMEFSMHTRNDSRRIPGLGFDATDANSTWTPNWGGVFAGADDLHIFVRASVNTSYGIVSAFDDVSGYEIRGENPTNNTVNNLLGGFPAENIACWESAHRLDQFESSPGWPLFGAPDGWGIMQLDNPPENCPKTESTIWNWRENVDMGLCTIAGKRAEAQASINRTMRNFPNAPAFPDTVNISGSTYDALEIDAIKRYNGGRYFAYDPTSNEWVIVNAETSNPQYVSNVLNSTCP